MIIFFFFFASRELPTDVVFNFSAAQRAKKKFRSQLSDEETNNKYKMVNYGSHTGPKPGELKRNRIKNISGLGRSLVNDKTKAKKNLANSDRYSTETDNEPSWVKLQSKTQQGALDEFLSTAELEDKDFTTERTAMSNVTIISHPGSTVDNPHLLTDEQREKQKVQQAENAGRITVPRRPKWTKEMSAKELDRLEKDAFLDWRRSLAQLQENHDLLLTPFERNIEVWRQLWRVVDRSDLIVQIADARNPLLFRSEDLDLYVKQVDERKNNLLLINKADLMTVGQRQVWADYFQKHGITYAFFSASTALREVERQELEEEKKQKGDASESESESDDDEEEEKKEEDSINNHRTRILTVDQLESLFINSAPEPLFSTNQLQIGLVGYPNVGKSSTINALIGAKKVSVSSTPGKTKHFQTIVLTPRVVLCDCPGLVFPNFAQTNADLVCNGVLPIDQLREYTGPTQLVASRIPKYFLEAIYGITIQTRPLEDGGSGIPTADELLYSYAKARGYMRSGQGTPDESRAARYILKDYVNAKLLFVNPPPDYENSEQEFNLQLYNSLDSLPEQRKQQILQAIKASRNVDHLDVNQIDLATELKNLKFAQHDPSSSSNSKNHQPVSTRMYAEGQEIDDEFFASTSMGTTKLPFHLQKAQQAGGGGKKHNKKNKKNKK